ncbi:MAG: phytoene desaturase family protein [Bdellovibrionales bacterium]
MPNLKPNYDAIIIGGGHNGLVTAGYLAKAGHKVAVFEKRYTVGGCAVTEETFPGFKFSSLSYVNSLFKPQIIADLKLREFGFEMLPRNPSSFTPFLNGKSLLLGPDKDLVRREISKFSTKDAERYPQYEALLEEMAEVLEPMMTMTPPNPGNIHFSDLTGLGGLLFKNRKKLKHNWPELMRFLTGSATDMLNHWFESEELKTTLATDAVIGANASPSMPGTSYILFHHVMGECNGVRGVWGYMRGGMGGLTQSLAKSCTALGVDIFTSMPVQKIMIQNGKAKGVIADGKEIGAKIVASGADPNMTFLKLVDEQDLPESFLQNVRRINYDSASVKINFALSELPDFKAMPGKNLGPQHMGTIHICPDMQYIEEAYSDSVAGRPSRNPILECTIPTSVDNTLAPAGQHVMNMFVQYGPYNLKNGQTWDQIKDSFADRCVEIMNEYAPNFKNSILHRQVISPLDMEREYSITGGSLFHGRMSLDQMFHMRPVPGYANYRTPVQNLYLCGSGAHPGGGVMGTPGLNAAQEILKDL